MTKIEHEKIMVERMIRLYCRGREGNRTLCADCREVLDYAHRRLDMCRYGEAKPACKNCPTHCYTPRYRAKIREIMRYSGPRMLLRDPVGAIRHWLGK